MSIFARSLGNVQVEIKTGAHSLRADEPVESGGADTGPNPYDLLLARWPRAKSLPCKCMPAEKDGQLQALKLP